MHCDQDCVCVCGCYYSSGQVCVCSVIVSIVPCKVPLTRNTETASCCRRGANSSDLIWSDLSFFSITFRRHVIAGECELFKRSLPKPRKDWTVVPSANCLGYNSYGISEGKAILISHAVCLPSKNSIPICSFMAILNVSCLCYIVASCHRVGAIAEAPSVFSST